MRYFFIVHNEKALLLGKERVKKIFYFISIMVPLIMTVLHACTLPVPPSVYSIAHKTCHIYLKASYNITCQTDLIGNTDNCAPILPFVLQQIPTVVTKNVGLCWALMAERMPFHLKGNVFLLNKVTVKHQEVSQIVIKNRYYKNDKKQ